MRLKKKEKKKAPTHICRRRKLCYFRKKNHLSVHHHKASELAFSNTVSVENNNLKTRIFNL